MKLSKIINNFKQKHLTNETIRMLQDYEILRTYLPQIFPDEESIEILSLVQPKLEDKNIKVYTKDFLPLHTQDINWLAKYVETCLKKDIKNGVELPRIKFQNIKSFVEVDPEFKAERDRYEADLTFVEIENLLISRKPEDTSDYKAMQDRINKSMNAEETFRNEIFQKMTSFGLNAHNVETTLESYADIWRSEAMDKTYINRYLRPLFIAKDKMPEAAYVKILDRVAAQRYKWKALRERQYYEKHQRIIDELGLVTDNMKISYHQAYEREIEWQHQYETNIIPIWDLAYTQTDEQINAPIWEIGYSGIEEQNMGK